MNKKFLSLAVAAAMAAPMAAQAQDVTLYGKAHLAVSNYSVGNALNAGQDFWDLASHESRIGVKGSEDLGNGMKAIFKMEFQVRMADDATTSANVINNGDVARQMTGRNMYVGLAADWGTFLMGRHDTPLKLSTASLDVFDGTIADYNGNAADNAEGVGAGNLLADTDNASFSNVRADNAIAYVSPNMNGLTIAAAIVPSGNATVTGSNNNAADGLAEAVSIAAIYSNGPFFATLARTDYSSDIVATANNTDAEITRAGLGYTANNFHVNFVYEDIDTSAVLGADATTWQLAGTYTFGNNVVKASYRTRENQGVNNDVDQWALGIDHNLSKRTKVYAVYTDVSAEAVGQDWSAFSAGMVTNF